MEVNGREGSVEETKGRGGGCVEVLEQMFHKVKRKDMEL